MGALQNAPKKEMPPIPDARYWGYLLFAVPYQEKARIAL